MGPNDKSWAPAQRKAMMKDDQGKLHLPFSFLKSIQLLLYYPKRINFSRKHFFKCLVFRYVKIIKFSWLATRQCIFSLKASHCLYTEVVFWGIKMELYTLEAFSYEKKFLRPFPTPVPS